jgi:HPt (histidine-containing phosphotransfer) domain-containing protein
MPEETPIIDIDDALKRAMGDVDFLKMMFEEFISMLPDYINRINQAIQQADMEALGKDAHQFKGAAANLGAQAIAACALELEQIGKGGTSQRVSAAFDQLTQAVETFVKYYTDMDWSTVSP